MKYQQGFVPLVIILLVVMGVVAGGGYVVFKDKQTQEEFEKGIDNLSNSSENDKSDKPSTNITTSSKNTTSFVSIPDPIYIAANNNFKKDGEHVYYENKVLLNADPATFQVIGGLYSKDKNNVFVLSCWGEGYAGCAVILEDADPSTFTVISDVLAKDSLHVFYLGKILKDADPVTIKIAGQEKYESRTELSFIKDRSHVWRVFGGGDAKLLPNADPATFVPLTWYYSRDAKSVYFFESIVSGADPATFEVLKEIYYGKDKKNVYHAREIILGADAKTFISIGGGYFKDSTSVYKGGVKMLDTEPGTFRVLIGPDNSQTFSINKNRVYWGELNIPNADATTFVSLGEHYGKDKNFVYFKNRKVPGADVATFRANAYVALDKNHYYEFDKVLNSPSESQYGGWEELGVKVPPQVPKSF